MFQVEFIECVAAKCTSPPSPPPISYKEDSPKALAVVHVFKCKIAADIQHGVCIIKATKILAAPCPDSCQTVRLPSAF